MTDTQVGSHYHNSLPSDFTDVQPRSYDPQFISQISNKMQVPDSIKAVPGMEGTQPDPYIPGQMAAVSMQVPDRITLVDDQSQGRNRLERFDFTNSDRQDNMNYVGLQTPPRILTMEEAFATNGDDMEEFIRKPMHGSLPNGDTHAPVPYTPGASLSDSLLHNEDDDATQLRTQVAKLSRRVTTLEQENQRRSTRDLILYPVVIAYLVSKMFFWMFRSRH